LSLSLCSPRSNASAFVSAARTSVPLKPSRVPGAGGYEAQLCVGDPVRDEDWKHAAISTRCSRIELTGLTSGQLYCVRVRAINGNGPGAWSVPASLMAT
jgi:hypothetical protein